jgi:hypothetical protein
MVSKLEASAALEHQLLIGTDQLWALHESQLWAKMGISKTTNAKLQIKGQWPNMKANNGLKWACV